MLILFFGFSSIFEKPQNLYFAHSCFKFQIIMQQISKKDFGFSQLLSFSEIIMFYIKNNIQISNKRFNSHIIGNNLFYILQELRRMIFIIASLF